ncbi:uncharacterized protein BJ171DRAFT_175797 [Polychytrium aggregatum]|uniref:uncharacterized protein n=1 Tax=Polychytrium aggregatum TaxID=110093 RepID=UPI0022FF1335|nr:uncharacterized protein BJ171DRAFT_175797 [Polychytrium aggregatum]KAI9209140.1 hypothetical protein BJ171DRAFT_175797 [Polychytrium aggregatum]
MQSRTVLAFQMRTNFFFLAVYLYRHSRRHTFAVCPWSRRIPSIADHPSSSIAQPCRPPVLNFRSSTTITLARPPSPSQTTHPSQCPTLPNTAVQSPRSGPPQARPLRASLCACTPRTSPTFTFRRSCTGLPSTMPPPIPSAATAKNRSTPTRYPRRMTRSSSAICPVSTALHSFWTPMISIPSAALPHERPRSRSGMLVPTPSSALWIAKDSRV